MRFILLLVAVLLVGGFAAQNWPEFTRQSELLVGPVLLDAPLGVILLTLLGLGLIAFLLASAAMRTRSLVESRHHYKSLEAQRDLADRAEASRFTELRQHLDASHQSLRDELANQNRALLTRLAALESRMDARVGTAPAWGSTAGAMRNQEVRAEHAVADAQVERARAVSDAHAERARAEEARELELRDERLREERARTEREGRGSGFFRNWR